MTSLSCIVSFLLTAAVLIIPSPTFSSGGGGYYTQPKYSKPAKRTNYSQTYEPYKAVEDKPLPKTQKQFERFMLSQDRDQVTLNNIKIKGKNFEVTGIYFDEKSFKNFVDKLRKKHKAEVGFNLKTWTTRFAGSNTYHYKLEGLNLW